jgi:hypothetical protein
MTTRSEYDPVAFRRADDADAGDSELLDLIDELRRCESRRDALLERVLSGTGDQIGPAAKAACDAARELYVQIAAVKPTTLAGVLAQLELIQGGWIALSPLRSAIATLREIISRPAPLKMGPLPPGPLAGGSTASIEIGEEKSRGLKRTSPAHSNLLGV